MIQRCRTIVPPVADVSVAARLLRVASMPANSVPRADGLKKISGTARPSARSMRTEMGSTGARKFGMNSIVRVSAVESNVWPV